MSSPETPVFAAVPNFNMADSLSCLLPQLISQGYDQVYVLDDASTDSSREVVEGFAPQVTFVPGDKNVGAGPNRNRIIDALEEDGVIHFIDADMDLITENNPESARLLASRERCAFVGGMILEETGLQFPFNFGPSMNLKQKFIARRHVHIAQLAKTDPPAAAELRARYTKSLRNWPDTLDQDQKPRKVDWATEGNLIIDSKVFRKLGGFDSRLRHHEIQDFAWRAEKQGLDGFFDPSIVMRHKNIDVRGKRRRPDAYKALIRLAVKHGASRMLD